MKNRHKPKDDDKYTCPQCGAEVKHKSPYIYATRHIQQERIQVLDEWNVPYSTGIYLLAEDDATEAEVDEYARKRVAFPFWSCIRRGVLWSKSTWDD